MLPTPSPHAGARLLIADDSRTQVTLLQRLLQQSGYQVDVARDGRETLDAARANLPDLVISDIVMPVMDGYAMCRALKCDPQLSGVPVMLLTALSDPSDIVQGLQSGADYYLTKPYDHEYLLSTVRAILSQPHRCDGETSEEQELGLEILVAGQHHRIGANRRQMLNLLLSTYGNSVQQNRVLMQTQHELRTSNAQLLAQRQQIEAQQRELQEANHRLRQMAMRDGLTGLRNQRAFQERLAEELDRTHRHGDPLSLLLLDVDKFKQFNDSFGHLAGDETLRQVGRLMEGQARSSDFVARYGGEEFAVLLPNTSRETSHIYAERIRAAIANAPWEQRQVTVSIGIATTPPADADAATLISQADAAMYASKAAGRNRITHTLELADVSG